MILVGILLGNQVFGGGDEIVEYILFFLQHAGLMPVFSELGAAAKVGDRKDASVFEPNVASADKARGQANVKTAVSGQQRGVVTIQL